MNELQFDSEKRKLGEKPAESVVERDLQKDEYEDFDDYIEMTIQFGYVTMFAAAMPIASTVACLYTFVEMRADLLKLLYLTRRPQAERSQSIGIWATVVQVLCRDPSAPPFS